jgi:2-oxoglutarate ferredoxin oxidoreductase subunit alpha
MDICAMYPITPATSASHYLSEVFEKVGGMVHQAEDEIAAWRSRSARRTPASAR